MKIVVIDIAASCGGAMSVLKSFYNYVKVNDKNNSWIFLLSERYLDETDNIEIKCFPDVKKSHIRKLSFDYIYGVKIIEAMNPDIVLSLQNTAVWGLKVPQVVFVHQSIPFQNAKTFSFLKREERKLAVYQHLIGRVIKQSVKKANHVIVQTNWMKEAVCQSVHKRKSDISVVYPDTVEISVEKDDIVWDKHKFFYPTSDEMYKNVECIVNAKRGINNEGFSECKITVTLPKGKYDQYLDCIGFISHEEVLKRLKESTLIFPSYIETVGLPLLEARSVGTVILASDCAFSHEILKGYENAYFFNPFDYSQLERLIKNILEGNIKKKTQMKDQMSFNGSWQEVIDILEEIR